MKNHSKTFTQVSVLSKRKMIEQGLHVVAGVDLGDKHSHVCLIDLDANIAERKKLRTSPVAFEHYFGGWAPGNGEYSQHAAPLLCDGPRAP